ncbi:DUF4192 domain-containing protein [Cellulomonas chengniuliangii]|uniref:DUF4192 domain-containing protein n=1 Tax=Cellulomonas chengniuliangii TaxID=2968084 RepID=A0ABY5KTU7_9CELL|nr:DUF4192 domain-containing protein [Cellulomonas chengniuliangii]MCC2308589.1 DUF4192 domain-containing protein [Cellulomonas chengniuliangii]MCC2317606.1 DUF4192 domain-containing protein [Cellulomonas chengniuliangii]UUI73952.1 DUF4192 domain-containing protein [Cellulomonas chengniuliangii]
MDTTTVRVNDPRELLAYLPHQLGFAPRESAVAVSLRAPRGRVGLVARVDLADLGHSETGPQVARGLVAHLGANRACGAVLVLYTASDPRGIDPAGAVARAAARHFRDAATPPFGDVAVWVVTSTGYLRLDCDEPACCPAQGRPSRDLDSTVVGAHMVLAGSCVASSREAVARIDRAAAPARRSAARAAQRWLRRGSDAERDGLEALAAWRAQSLEAWARCVEAVRDPIARADPPSALLGRLEAGLSDRRVRDAVLVSLVPGVEDLPERSLREDAAVTGAEMAAAIGAIIDPERAVSPPPGPLSTHAHALERVVAHGRHGAQAPALTLLALLAWWSGDGARASVLLERALSDDPGHRLARLLDDVLTAGMPPGWASAS